MSGRDKKEYKIVIQKEKDPELYKWALSLNYGLFPKLIIEMLRWYEKNGLLVKGGVASPDLLMSLNQNIPNIDRESFEKQVIEKLNLLELLLDSKTFKDVDSGSIESKSKDTKVLNGTQWDRNPDSQENLGSSINESKVVEDNPKLDEQDEIDDSELLMIPSPMQANFKVFRYEKKDDQE